MATVIKNKPVALVATVETDRDRALRECLATLERRFGPAALQRLGDAPQEIEAIPTGFPALDAALGVQGVPRGKIVDIFGPESAGKTTLCLHIIAQAQQAGGLAAFVDMEHGLDRAYAEYCGVDPGLYVAQPDTGEQALEIVDGLVRSGVFDVVVVDSAAALVPRAELEGEMGDNHAGLQARLMSQALRKLAGPVATSNCCLIFTNQLRHRQGAMFGNPESSTGGWALRFYAAVRLDVRRTQALKSAGQVIGDRIRVVVKKNKVAPPFRTAELDLWHPGGER